MKKLIIFTIIFLAGYYVRGVITPYMVIGMLPKNALTKPLIEEAKTIDNAPGNLRVVYENGRFKPSNGVMAVSRYLTIVNGSDSPMWLESDYPGISTPRGYMRSETVHMRIDKPATITFRNKLNINAVGTVRVIP